MPSSAGELLLLKLYKQLADTMQTLIEIEQLENEMEVPQTNKVVEDNDESKSVACLPKIPPNKKTARMGLFDDTDDIKRLDQVIGSDCGYALKYVFVCLFVFFFFTSLLTPSAPGCS